MANNHNRQGDEHSYRDWLLDRLQYAPDDRDIRWMLRAHMCRQSLVAHQIDSCNNFFMHTLTSIVNENSTLVVHKKARGECPGQQLEFTFKNVVTHRPSFQEASGQRLRTTDPAIRGPCTWMYLCVTCLCRHRATHTEPT